MNSMSKYEVTGFQADAGSVVTSIGYLLVGVILGPYTIGPTFTVPEFKTLAEFGVVFLLFTIGLNYSLPQLHASRHQVLGLGTAVGNLALAGALGWAIGKAVLAFALVYFAGRWLLRPLFQLVTRRRSAEVFTLAVLLQDTGIAFMAFDTDSKRVAQGKADGHQVVYGDLMAQEVRDWEYKPVLEEEEGKEP